MKKVGIIMGSHSDLPVVRKAVDLLKTLDIPYEVHVYSAHRTPEQARDFARSARANGFGAIIAAAGSARRDLIGKRISTQLEQVMEDRGIYQASPNERSIFVTESLDRYCATVAAPIISEGDALGLVLFIGSEGETTAGETEYKLAQTIASFLGKHMES